jgi:hypothetical protein
MALQSHRCHLRSRSHGSARRGFLKSRRRYRECRHCRATNQTWHAVYSRLRQPMRRLSRMNSGQLGRF